MATRADQPPRPGILTLITILSVLLSIVDVLWFAVLAAVAFGIAVFSWLGARSPGRPGRSSGRSSC